MKVIVPVALSLVATLIAVVAVRLIARYDVRIDLKELPAPRDARRSVHRNPVGAPAVLPP